jgi:hypothetical protein
MATIKAARFLGQDDAEAGGVDDEGGKWKTDWGRPVKI